MSKRMAPSSSKVEAVYALEWIHQWFEAPKLIVVMIVLVSALLRLGVGYHAYSGASTPPMFGDYEAQRHWMEITSSIPLKDWYFNTTDNDLQYWGLDYPPLTAYHSWIMAKIAEKVEPDTVALHSSRGIETPSSKLFMRMTAFVSDMLVFVPGVIWTINTLYKSHSIPAKQLAIAFVLCLPSIILIDHGHFQYNTVSLGFAIWAIGLFVCGSPLLSCISFTLSMCYKQMSIYYAPAFLFIMFGACLKKPSKVSAVLSIASHGIAVIGTLLLCFAPFLVDLKLLQQVLHRMFPFARGLYEDKVANFWCVSHVLIKWRSIFRQEHLVKLCLGSTVISLLPNAWFAIRRPSSIQLLYSLASSSFSFFLFSFQVHEKSILLPLVPVSMLCLYDPILASWMSTVSAFSMFPLLKKDGLIAAYICLQLFGFIQSQTLPQDSAHSQRRTKLLSLLNKISLFGMLLLHMTMALVPAPDRFPDLHDLAVAVYSAFHFSLFWLMCLFEQYHLSSSKSKKKTE